MYRVRNVFAVKNATVNIALGKDGDLLDEFELFERFDQIEAAGAVWLGDPLKFTLNKDGAKSPIFRQLMLPPANRQVTAKRFAVVEVCSDDGCFKIEAELHEK